MIIAEMLASLRNYPRINSWSRLRGPDPPLNLEDTKVAMLGQSGQASGSEAISVEVETEQPEAWGVGVVLDKPYRMGEPYKDGERWLGGLRKEGIQDKSKC